MDGLDGGFAEVIGEIDEEASGGGGVIDVAERDGARQHFFEAEGLGAKLELVVFPVAFSPAFVFDGVEFSRFFFEEVGDANEVVAAGEDPHSADLKEVAAAGNALLVDILVEKFSFHGVRVFGEDIVQIHQIVSSGAVIVVVEGGDGDGVGSRVVQQGRNHHRIFLVKPIP